MEKYKAGTCHKMRAINKQWKARCQIFKWQREPLSSLNLAIVGEHPLGWTPQEGVTIMGWGSKLIRTSPLNI